MKERGPIDFRMPQESAVRPFAAFKRQAVLRVGGAVAVGVLGTAACIPADASQTVNIKPEAIVRTVNPELERRLDDKFDQFKREVKTELAGSNGEQVKLPNSPQEMMDWFFSLDAKQQVAVVMYGVMALYFARFLVRGTRAFIDPGGDIRLIKPKPKKKDESDEPDESLDEQEDKRPYGPDSVNEFLRHIRGVKIKVRGVEIQSEIADITRKLATRISEGLSLSEAIDGLADQGSNQVLTEALKEITKDVKSGSTLAQGLGKYPNIFPRFYVNLVKSGEVPGALDKVLLRAADSLEVEGVKFRDRLEALKDSIVKDPQNLRSAMGVSGFLASSIIKFLDEGAIGNLDVNTNIMIVALFAALLPPFKAFDRFKEKINLEYISKTAPAIAGAFVGINEAGLFYKSEDINFLQTFLIVLTFGTLFKYASMGIGSREYVSNLFDLLNMPEDLRRFDALLKNRRIPAQARNLVEALIDGRRKAITKKGGILDETFAALDQSYREDGTDPDKLAITLPRWREIVEAAANEFIASVGKDNSKDGESKGADAQRRSRAKATERRHRKMTRIRRPLR